MTLTAINRTISVKLTNKSGADVNIGDVVVLSSSHANSFYITGSAGMVTDILGVVLEPRGIANDSIGMIAVGGYIQQVNLVSGSSLGDTFNLSSTAGKAIPHTTIQAGDFGQVLTAGITPEALLWEKPERTPILYGKILLSDITLTGTSSFDISNISQDYTDLEIVAYIRVASANDTDNIAIRFNNDTTSSNYHRERHFGSSSTGGQDAAAQPGAWITCANSATAGYFTLLKIYIPQYSNTSRFKILGGDVFTMTAASFVVEKESVVWKNANAISRINLDSLSGSAGFVSGSRIQLFGHGAF